MLVFMAVNHIPTELQIATNHIFGFVSAAEGFVFLAGLLAGMVYTRKLDRGTFPEMRAAGFRRAATIYRYHLAAYFAIFAWVLGFTYVMGNAPACSPALMHDAPWLALIAGPFFIYQPVLLDILPMYCVFIFVLPFLLRWLEAGHRARILVGSLALWAFSNVVTPQHPLVYGMINTGAFDPGAWQLLFVGGVVFGHAWARRQVILPAPRAWIIALMLATAACFYAVRHAFLPMPWSFDWLNTLTNKNNLAPIRLLNFSLLAYLVYLSVSRFPAIMHWRPLAFLGRHSLTVFSVHVVIATVLLAFPGTFAETPAQRWLATGILLGGMFTVATIADARSRKGLSPSLPARQSAPPQTSLPDGKRTVGAADPVHR